MAPSPARLTFFCELEEGPLEALFADPTVVEHLVALRASVSLGMIDLGPAQASVVGRLNQVGVPVIAWQLLPKEHGYWFNQDNASHAVARYEDFRAWTDRQGLRWDGVGLDIEPDIHDLQRMVGSGWRMLPSLFPRLARGERLRKAQAEYAALLARIRADGYRVDSYQFPFIVDERRTGATLLQRLTGVLDLPVDREVLMLYSSFVRPHGPGLLWSYGPDARSIGLGVTGGGVDVPELLAVPPMDWEEFARDLWLARRWTDDLHVYSLEGCVRQGFLARLRDFDWEKPVEAPASAGWVNGLRRVAGLVLRVSSWLA